MSDLSLLSGIYRTSRLLADFRYLRTSAVRRSNLHTTFQRGRISQKNSDGCNFRLLQHGVIPGSSQTKARESALQERMGPASCGLATVESGNGVLCRIGRVVEANIDLRGGPDGVSRARGRGRFRS